MQANIKRFSYLWIFPVAFWIMATFLVAKTTSVKLDFKTNLISPYGAVALRDGSILEVKIKNVPNDDVDITVNGIPVEKKSTDAQGNKESNKKEGIETFTINITHRSEMGTYLVSVNTPKLKRSWFIPVITNRWEVDFSGAFTFDTIGKKVYHLKAVTQNPITNATENGFIVEEYKDGSSKIGLGTAAMVHLYYNTHKSHIQWVPISFGIGVSSGSDLRYYLGTSLRFGGSGFFTAGAVCSDIDIPPANAALNSFVTNDKALETMGKKKKWGLFVGFSYAFTGSNSQQRLLQPFALPNTSQGQQGQTTVGTQTTTPETPTDNPPTISGVVKDPGNDKKIIIEGSNFGNDTDKIVVTVKGSSGFGANISGDPIIAVKEGKKIEFDWKDAFSNAPKGTYEISVKVNKIESNTYNYKME